MEEIVFLAYTIAIETPVSLLLLRKASIGKVLLATTCVSMITHPVAWNLVISHQMNWWVTEAGVALFEGLVFYWLFPTVRIRAAFTGVAMNIVSAAIGRFL